MTKRRKEYLLKEGVKKANTREMNTTPKNFNNFHIVWVCENYVGQCPLPNVYLIYRMFQKWYLPLS
jgi:hypothetical protein